MSILASMVKYGLLLTPERFELRESLADGTLGKQSFILQKRICFTELAPAELSAHCEQFGPFAIQWEVGTLIQMGAVPVFYVPLRETSGANDGIATSMLSRLGDIQDLLSRLESLERLVQQMHNPHETLNFPPNGVVAASTTCTVSDARNLLQYLQAGIQPVAALTATVRYMFGHFYPTENLSYTGPLDYYRQREWRILANIVNRGVPVTDPISQTDADAISGIDAAFFGREQDFPSGRLTLASECHLYRTFRGRHVLESASRLVVPGHAINAARELLDKANLKVEVVEVERHAA